MVDVSVVLVTWNNENEIENCVGSVVISSGSLSVELIIIDNDSSDNTFDKANHLNYSNLQTYRNSKNLGFTKAVNQGIRYSRGKNILLLNPDTVIKDNCIEVLHSFLLNNPAYAACSPLLLNEDGSVQNSIRNFPDYWTMFCEFSLLAYIFPSSRAFGKWKMKYFKYDRDADVNQPMAAALMFKRDALEKAGFMDERFEMFFNDVDLCKNIIDSGNKIRFIKEAKAVHQLGASIYKDRLRMIRAWDRDCIRYFDKYHRSWLLWWLKINLKISEIIRILYHKFTD